MRVCVCVLIFVNCNVATMQTTIHRPALNQLGYKIYSDYLL